jgi:hypothetical protein
MEFPQLKAWLRLPVRLNFSDRHLPKLKPFAKHIKRMKVRTVRTHSSLPAKNSFLIERTSPDITRRLVSIYDIKFYPYTAPGEDPVFAAVAGREVSHIRPSINKILVTISDYSQIYICRPIGKSAASKTNNLEVLRLLEDPDVRLQCLCSANPTIRHCTITNHYL